MNSPRIVLISSNSSGRGGGERYLAFLVQGLRQLGIDTHLLLSTASYMDGWARELASLGATVHRWPLKALGQRRLRFVGAVLDRRQRKLIAAVCDTIRPDAILVNQQYDEDGLDYVMGALASRCTRVAGIMHMPMTASKDQRPFGRLRGMLLARWYAKFRYQLLFVSDGSRAEFEAYYPHVTGRVIRNGIPMENIAARSRARRSEAPTIGFVGQLVPQKNLVSLVEAWLALRSLGIRTRLLLVGDGPERARIEQILTQRANTGEWHITGWVADPEPILDDIDIFVMCSHFEGLPLSLVEAAARGIPCVVTTFNGASDVASKAEWVHVAADGTPEAMARTLAAVLQGESARSAPEPDALDRFREYFSVRRMAAETAGALGLAV